MFSGWAAIIDEQQLNLACSFRSMNAGWHVPQFSYEVKELTLKVTAHWVAMEAASMATCSSVEPLPVPA